MKTASPPKLDHRGLPPPVVDFTPRGEVPFWVFLLVSMTVFAGGTLLGIYWKPADSPAVIEINLDYIEGVENEPPPLGTPDAGGPAAPEEAPKPPEPEPPPPPEPEPPPPPPEPVPAPPVQPEFPKPEEKPATPVPSTPRPKAASPKPAGSPKPVVVPNPKTAPGGTGTGESDDPNAKPGPRGVPDGVAGGRGGQKGGFIARPDPPYDNLMLTRKYQGTGRATLTVSGGRIVSVSLSQSTGNSYLDSKALAWIRARWKPAPGAEGTFTFPVVFRLR
jgi:protein TonB